jgi:hypothetical protein
LKGAGHGGADENARERFGRVLGDYPQTLVVACTSKWSWETMQFCVFDRKAIQQVTNCNQRGKIAGTMIQIMMLNVRKCAIIALIM